jgi:20S proteasome subunit alpha 7
LEMTWVRLEKGADEELAEGVTAKGWGKHEEVPKELVAEAERLAKVSIEGGDDEEMEE